MIRPGHDPQSCVNGIILGRPDVPGPISQLLGTWTPLGVRWNGSNPDPRIVVIAAGRSNHAGSGEYPWGAPSGNGSSIGIEWCGPPETGDWPDVVIELRERVDAAILRWNNWGIHQLTTHWEYARPVGRKIDPSGPWKYDRSLPPLGHWNPEHLREAVAARLGPPVPLPPPPLEEEIVPCQLIVAKGDNAVWETDGMFKTWVSTPEILEAKRWLYAARGWSSAIMVVEPVHMAAFGPVVGPVPPSPPVRDAWGKVL